MTTASASRGPRYLGYEGTRDFGNWSSQNDRTYLVICCGEGGSGRRETGQHLQELADLHHVLERALHVVRVGSGEAGHERRALGVDRQLEADLEIHRRADPVRLQ